MKRTLGLLLLVLAAASELRAQGDAGSMIAAARAQLEQFNTDSASALLERALAPTSGATTAERVRAYVLYGIAQLTAQNVASARQSFRRALQLNPAERVDSLEFLEPEQLLREFNAERAAVVLAVAPAAAPAVEPLKVDLGLPADTILAMLDGRLPITATPSRKARTVVAVAPADAPTAVLWTDTLPAGATGALGWALRARDGTLVQPGRYAVLATALDSAGGISQTVERVVAISRVPADTQPLPPALTSSSFAPETLHIRHGSPVGLLLGAGLGAAAAFLPGALGRPELNKGLASDGTAYVVAGSVTVAGLIGFLAGHRVEPLPENALKNAELRRQDASTRAAITAANARARDEAPIRVRLEGGGP
jgi:hypothetical protein